LPVVGIDFFKTIFSGASKMHGIPCAQMQRLCEICIGLVQTGDHDIGEWQPGECSDGAFSSKLTQKNPKHVVSESAFPEFSMKGSQCLSLPEKATGDVVCGSDLTDLLPPRILNIESDNVTGVEIDHDSDLSLSSEIMSVLSVPP
jgi:hypothetical protein